MTAPTPIELVTKKGRSMSSLLDKVRNYDWTIVNLNETTLSLTSDSLDDPEAAILGKDFQEVLTKLVECLIEQGEKL